MLQWHGLKTTTWKWIQASVILLFHEIKLKKCVCVCVWGGGGGSQIGEHEIWEIRIAKLLGITIENNLKL